MRVSLIQVFHHSRTKKYKTIRLALSIQLNHLLKHDIALLCNKMMRWCDDAMMRWCDDAMMRWCDDAMMRWCDDAMMRWCLLY